MAIRDMSLTAGMRANLILQGTIDLLKCTQERLYAGRKKNVMKSSLEVMGVVVLSILFAVSLTACDVIEENGGFMSSQREIDVFSEQIAIATTRSFGNISKPANAPSLVNDTNFTYNALVNYSFSGRTNCTAGGYIEISGRLSGSISDQGSGMLQISATETITDWRCIGGNVINGDPYISLAGTFSFLNWAPATTQTISIGGGFKWGTSAAESCQIRLTINFPTAGSGSTSVSGTICGRNVNISNLMVNSQTSYFSGQTQLSASEPYTYDVSYSDETTETETGSVRDTFVDYPIPLSPAYGEVINTFTPTFSWQPPSCECQGFYRIWIVNSQGDDVWSVYPPKETTSVVYNFDGQGDALQSGETYEWRLIAFDEPISGEPDNNVWALSTFTVQ